MDLKSFAVLQKLAANSDLLEYVVENKPVPIPVLEDNLKTLLSGQEDADAEMIVKDYQQFLRKHVGVAITPEGDSHNEFAVSGSIEDPLIESIEILHGVDRKEVVTDLVGGVMGDLKGDRELKITAIDLAKSTDEFLAMTSPIVTPQAEIKTVDSTLPEQSVQAVAPEIVEAPIDYGDKSEQKVEFSPSELADMSFLNDSLPDAEISELPPAVPTFDEPDDASYEAMSDADVDTVIDSNFGSEYGSEYSAESSQEVEPDTDADADVDEGGLTHEQRRFKEAYDLVISLAKKYKLDERLPGLHIA